MGKISLSEIAQCSEILSKLEPGILPFEIFSQVARLVRLPMLDLIPYKKEGNRKLIGLLKRDANDPWWPDKWTLPGTVITVNDTFESAIDRLTTKEIKIKISAAPIFLGHIIHESERGCGIIFIYSAADIELEDNSPLKWFELTNLPDNFVASEGRVVEMWQSFD